MPALPAAPGVIKVTLGFTIGVDTTAQSSFHVHYSGTAPTDADLVAFCTSVANSWNTNMPLTYPTANSLTSVNAEDLSSSTGAVGHQNVSIPGTNGGGITANSVALMIQFLIARRYRGGKPKVFLPIGAASDITTGGVWLPAFITAVQTDWSAFMAGVLSAGWTGAGTLTQVSVSYYSGFTVVTNPITHRARNVPTLRGTPIVDPVLAISVEPGIASQRRRNQV